MTAPVQALSARDVVERRLRSAGGDRLGLVLQVALLLSLLISLGVLAVLIGDIVVRSLPVFAERPIDFLGSALSSRPARAGILQGVLGSVLLMGFVAALALPLGVGAAVYLEEYARDAPASRLIRTNIRNLAGVPAIVYGILGLAVFVELLGDIVGPGSVAGRSLLAGGLTIALMVLPIIIITTQEALRAVPRSIREGGFGVGATRWEVIRSHVLPNAAPGILTGTVLSMARALGETAPLIMVGAVTGFFVSQGGAADFLYERFTSMPTLIFAWTKKPQPEFQDLAAAAILVLIVAVFLINLTAILLRNRYERKW